MNTVLQRLSHFIFTLLFFLSSSMLATELTIHSIPVPDIYAKSGDTIKLSLVITPQNVPVSWKLNNQELCTGLQCIVKTKDWGIGEHNIYATVSLDEQSFTLPFHLLLEERLISEPVKEFEPSYRSVSSAPFLSLNSNAPFAQSLAGFSFLSENEKTYQLIQNTNIKIGQGLRTLKDAIAGVSHKNYYHLRFFDAAEVFFHNQQEKDIIQLLTGGGRFRFLQKPNVHLLFSTWLKIIPTENSDFIVWQKNPTTFEISVLQGTVDLVFKDRKEGFHALTQPQGTLFLVTPFTEKKDFSLPQDSHIEDIIIKTNEGLGSFNLEQELNNKNLMNATLAIKDLVKEAKDLSPEKQILLGFSYFQTFQYKKAEIVLNLVTDKSYIRDVFFLKGLIAIARHNEDDARRYLAKINLKNYKHSALVEYYLGALHYRDGNLYRATLDLISSNWENVYPFLSPTYFLFSEQIEKESWFFFTADQQISYDSNFFRLSSQALPPQNISSKSFFVYNLNQILRSPKMGNNQAFLEVKGYAYEQGLVETDIYQLLGFGGTSTLSLFFPAQNQPETFLELNAEIKAGADFLSLKRTRDIVSAQLTAKLPHLPYQPELSAALGIHSDPYPLSDDVFDLELEERTEAHDRSNIFRTLAGSFTITKSEEREIKANLKIQKSSYQKKDAQIFNHLLLSGGASFEKISRRSRLIFQADLAKRRFSGKGSDLQIKANIERRFQFYPKCFFQTGGGIVLQSADLAQRSYNRYFVYLGLTWNY